MTVNLSTSHFDKWFKKGPLSSAGKWLLLSCIGTYSSFSVAQEREWWFDVEVIVYKQNIAPNAVREAFPERLNRFQTQEWADPISAYLYPDLTALYLAFPVCFATPPPEPPLALFDVEMDFPEFEPVNLEWGLETPDAETLASDTVSLPDELALQSTPAPVETQRIFEDGSIFSPAHLALWIDGFSLEQPQVPEQPLCRYSEQQAPTPYIENIPKLVQYKEIKSARSTQLLSSESLALSDLAKSIQRKRGLTTLLHMGWREQIVFGRENATPMRIIAGENFARRFEKDGSLRPLTAEDKDANEFSNQTDDTSPTSLEYQANTQIPNSEYSETKSKDDIIALSINDGFVDEQGPIEIDLMTQIKQALNDENYVYSPNKEAQEAQQLDSETPEDLWELDGSIRVFLRYIQRTPYLHIDTDLDIRTPVFEEDVSANQTNTNEPKTPSRLQSYPLKQMRRVISKQLHYFDHPMFGVVIQIRRFSFPEPPLESEQK